VTGASADRVKAAFITVLGSGYAPAASGSWGSLVAVALFSVLWFALVSAGAVSRSSLLIATLAGIALACVLSVRWGEWAIATFGRKDPKQFVLDEFAGQWIALLMMPVVPGASLKTLAVVWGLQFFLFRLFDVLKPPPARQLEQLPAGWGILLDDLFAGLYANLAGQAILRWTPLTAWFGVAVADLTISPAGR
jgi:phosphatidylglycerophosphatase A